ncbi:MAG: type II toxin-antitoxin system death-on-curing family toxin [Jatrophihabitans sp.]|uniref:type II toxin-antitoxin system death-on-curing family toxin n=1 Tax=Jatrophihabitans sp. TaxID=1932789 RepID=UPI003F814BC0
MTDYLTIEDLLAAADAALAPAPVLIRDRGLLESALARPQASAFGEDAYVGLWLKAAALLESSARNHALIDGNKRLAWVAMRLFVIFNGEDVRAPSPAEGDVFVRAVAQGQLQLDRIAATLEQWKRPAER